MKVTKVVVTVLATTGAMVAQPAAALPAFTPLTAEPLPTMERDLGPIPLAAPVFRSATGRLPVRVADPASPELVRANGGER